MIGDMGKYRPRTFDEVIGQKSVVERIRNQSRAGAWFSSQVLEGHWGSGKTTLARIMAKAMNCQNPDVNGNPCCNCTSCRAVGSGSPDYKEIDAASNTGVDNVRALIEWAGYCPVQLKCKIVVIDEAQQLSSAAWNAMLKLIEEPPVYMRFIFCTTDFAKIPETIRSRCAHYQLAAIPENEIAEHISRVAANEGVELTPGAAILIAKQAHGAMRDGLRILREMSAASERIDEKLVSSISPVGEEKSTALFLRALLNASVSELLMAIGAVEQAGRDFVSLMAAVISLCSDCVINSTGAAVSGTDSYREAVTSLCNGRSLEDFLAVSAVVLSIRDAMLHDPRKEHLIVTAAAEFHKPAGISLRVAELERRLAGNYTETSVREKPEIQKAVLTVEKEEKAQPEPIMDVSAAEAVVESDSFGWDPDAVDLFEDMFDDAANDDQAREIPDEVFHVASGRGAVYEPTEQVEEYVPDKAKSVEASVCNMIMNEDSLSIHFKNKRIRLETKGVGVRVICENFTLAKLVMAFVGKYCISDVEVTTA